MFEVANENMVKLTILVIQEVELKKFHRSRQNGSNILVDFLLTGKGSNHWKILGTRHYEAKKSNKI